MKRLLLLSVIFMVFSGCGVIKVEKRKHLKGFHVTSKQHLSGKLSSDIVDQNDTKYSENRLDQSLISSTLTHVEYSDDQSAITSGEQPSIQNEEQESILNIKSEISEDFSRHTYVAKYKVDGLKSTISKPIEARDYSDKRLWLIALGCVLMIVAIVTFIALLLYMGEILSLLALLGVIPAVALIYFGHQSNYERGNGYRINIFALLGFVLFFATISFLFIESLIMLAGISSMLCGALLLVALYQFRNNPDEYRAQWLAYIPYYSAMTLALIFMALMITVLFLII